MQIHVTGHQIEVTPALRKYTIDKLERTGRHFDGVYDTQVVLTVEKTHHRAEATVSAARHKVLQGSIRQWIRAGIAPLGAALERVP